MTELEIKQKANDLAEAVRNAYITGALDNAKGDSETNKETTMIQVIKTEIERRIKIQDDWIAKGLQGEDLALAVREELKQLLDFFSNLEKEDKSRLDMTPEQQLARDHETFAEHYGCLLDTEQEELRPVLPGAAVYEGLSDSLALAFSRYLDSNRGEGKMCLSGWECHDIMKAFRKQDWKRIERYRDKYLLSTKLNRYENSD